MNTRCKNQVTLVGDAAAAVSLIKQKQKAALKAASTFVPNTYLGILARNIVTRILPAEWAARLGLSLKSEAALIAYANEKPFKDI